jgi:small subunit ribosomal protein S7
MSRRHKAEKREINPDPKFGDLVITKFMNAVMLHGKKSVAESIVYGALSAIEAKAKSEPVPVDVRSERRQALAIRWLINAARGRNETTMIDRLSGELLDAANNRGSAVKKREDTHRMAEANRAFSHYRW